MEVALEVHFPQEKYTAINLASSFFQFRQRHSKLFLFLLQGPTVELEQKRFFLNPKAEDTDGYLWYIPINVAHPGRVQVQRTCSNTIPLAFFLNAGINKFYLKCICIRVGQVIAVQFTCIFVNARCRSSYLMGRNMRNQAETM